MKAYASVLDVPGTVDVASFYVPPEVGEAVIEQVVEKGVAEVWLNPGADSDALIAKARALGVRPIVACSIVALGINPAALWSRAPRAGLEPSCRGSLALRLRPHRCQGR